MSLTVRDAPLQAAWGDRPSDRQGGGANGPARPLRERWDSPRTPRTTSSDGITRDGASATLPRNAVCVKAPSGKAGASSSASRRSPSWEAGGSGHAYGSDQIDGRPPA